MKTIGLLGGMSWESTVTYYQLINEKIREEIGGLHSAKILMYSVDFDEIEKCQSADDWDKSAEILGTAAKNLENAGADFIVLGANTMHKIVPQLKKYISIPILHIAEATAKALKDDGICKAVLLGTKYTLKQDFVKQVLIDGGIDVMIPKEEDIEIVNRVIYDELCVGKIIESSQKEFLRIIDELKEQGAQAVIYGCTEIGLLLDGIKTSIPSYDTTVIHANAAAIRSLQD